ncbi:MAG: hypothetical protein CW338_08775 [Clostridiales bacterium]|nr:hypothetical protein [Clostridiales bacterium]
MAVEAVITYFHNSGFSVAINKTLLVFDYWTGEEGNLLPVATRLTQRDMERFEQIVFFVSSPREDHFDSIIYTYNFDKLHIQYVVSDDLPIGTRGKRIKAGDTMTVGTVTVTAFASTDIGVSLYVQAEGLSIFYAGDLNFWHWRDESSLREIRAAEKAFYDAVKPLERLPVDISMFPVDPRQGGMFDAGANYFIMAVKPRVMIPMHFQNKAEVVLDFARHGRTRYTETVALTKPREQAVADFDDYRLSVRVVQPEEKYTMRGGRTDVKLDNLSGSNPFSDTDRPVDIT